MIPFFLSLLIPVAIGLSWVCLFCANRGLRSFDFLLKASLGVGFGLGISSTLYFLELLLGRSSQSITIGVEGVLLLILLGILCYRGYKRRNHPLAPKPAPDQSLGGILCRILLLVFYLELVLAGLASLVMILKYPHGGWDAWSIWNMRARFIYRSGINWRDAFSPLIGWSHPDYPPLIPSIIARCWSYIAHETVAVPMAVAVLFTFAMVGLVCSSLSKLRSRSQGLLSGIVLLGTPFFIKLGAVQYADVPLSFFMLAALILLCLEDRWPESRQGFAFLAGMAAGFAAWTKNEGLLFVLALLVAQGVVLVSVRGGKAGFRQMAFFLGGLAPLVLLLLYFKTQVAPPNDLLSSLKARPAAASLLEASKYVQTIKAFAMAIMNFGEWTVHPLPILTLYLLALGVGVERRDWRNVGIVVIALGLTLGGYFFTYIVTPYDLRWHLLESLSRLLLQLWPSFVFLFFLVARCPEQSLTAKGWLEKTSDPRGIALLKMRKGS